LIAAYFKRHELLQWLHECGCPWDLEEIVSGIHGTGRIDLGHMKQLRAITGRWPVLELTNLMNLAASKSELESVKWCREQGAAWPKSFFEYTPSLSSAASFFPVQCALWATANGSTWGTWRCQDLASEHYFCTTRSDEHSDDKCDIIDCQRRHAHELFKWAHGFGCPCTCKEPAAAAAAAAVVL
jgi:hypothetical protein